MDWRVWLAIAALACNKDEPADGAGDDVGDDDDATVGDDDDAAGDDDDDTSGTLTGCAAEMAVAPGTGIGAYVPLNAGDPVTMVHGPQGGWHVDVGGRVSATPQEVGVECRIVVPSQADLQIAGDQQPQFLALAAYDAGVCQGDFFESRCFIDDIATPPDGMNYQEFICSLEGLDLELTVTVSDLAGGTTCTSTVTVTAQLDPNDVVACN